MSDAFEYVNESEIPAELRCAICTKPFEDPVQMQCEDIFCEACVPTSGVFTCPACGVEMGESKRVPRSAPKQMVSLADQLRVWCRFAARGCTWTGPRSQRGVHVGECTFSSVAPPPVRPEFVAEPGHTDEFCCSICSEVWIDPIAHEPCESVFCRPCLQNVRVQACPVCRGELSDERIRIPAKQLLAMWAKLPVYCRYKANGCAWQGTAAQFDAHCTTCTAAHPTVPTLQADAHTPCRPHNPATMHHMAAMDMRTQNEFAAIKAGTRHAVTMLHVDAPLVTGDWTRKPLNLSVAIDVSGSMRGRTLEAVKAAMGFVVRELVAGDTFGLVAFDDNVTVVLQPTRMSADGKTQALAAIASLRERGGTNLSGGLFTGISQARHLTVLEAADVISAVWLFTDGEPNCGIFNGPELVNATRDKLASHVTDVTVYTFGFGAGHNADLLKSIAETCDGSYYYIENTEMMTESFADCLGGLMSVVAQNIKLQVTCAPGVTIDRLMTSYTNTVTGNTAEVVLKDLYSEEKRDILLSLNTAAMPAAHGPQPLVSWTLAYRNVVTGDQDTLDADVTLTVHDVVGATDAVPDADVNAQRSRVLATEAMEAACAAAENGDLSAAQERLTACMETVVAGSITATPLSTAYYRDLHACVAHTSTLYRFQSSGSKIMLARAWGHGHQRSNVGALTLQGTPGTYSTSAKEAMKVQAAQFGCPVPRTPLPTDGH